MKEYIIVGRTMHETMSVFNYLLDTFRDKIERCSRLGRVIIIGDYQLRFTCQEAYDRYERFANHADVIPAYLVERRLDMYNVLIKQKKGENTND